MKFILMGRNNYFRFKQFTIIQEKSAMKVGIDGVLLGAWATAESPGKILDVGTGTGLIALMMAQRFENAKVDAVEIDDYACAETIYNFEKSPWAERLQLRQTSFQLFALNTIEKYDLIVSNPPFYENSVNVKTASRELARNSENLEPGDLFFGVSKLLAENGRFAIVFPFQRLNELRENATKNGLFLSRICKVKPNPEKVSHRILAEFSFQQQPETIDELVIESMIHHDYSEKYRMLTRDFYLRF